MVKKAFSNSTNSVHVEDGGSLRQQRHASQRQVPQGGSAHAMSTRAATGSPTGGTHTNSNSISEGAARCSEGEKRNRRKSAELTSRVRLLSEITSVCQYTRRNQLHRQRQRARRTR